METLQSSFTVDKYWQIFQKRWLTAIAVFLAVSTWGIITISLRSDIYEAEGKLKLKKNNPNFVLDNANSELEELISIAESTDTTAKTEAEIIRSTPSIAKTIDELKLTDKRQNPLTIQEFRQKLNVSVVPSTEILEISYRDSDPLRAKEIVNALIFNYLESDIAANQDRTIEAKKFLEKQIPKVRQTLLETETAIEELKSTNQILSPQKEASQLVSDLGNVTKHITEAKSEIANLTSQSEYLQQQLQMTPQQALKASKISQSPKIQRITARLSELESRLEQNKNVDTENLPTDELKQQIEGQKQLLSQQIEQIAGSEFSGNLPEFGELQQKLTVELIELESDIAGLNKQIAYLSQVEQELKQKANNFPEIEQQLTQLERQLGVSQKTYELLQNQLNSIEVAANQNASNVRVISYGIVPNSPISSRFRAIGYISALSLGLLAAVATIYFLESRDSSLKTVDDAKKLFGYDWLGVIPSYDRSQLKALPESQDLLAAPLIVRDAPESSASESYRMLQSNLRFASDDRPIQSIVVTSSVSGEGKSTVAANLAGTMAQVGHKVLLVDANLHDPTQKEIWGTYSDRGLSELLADNLDHQLATEVVMKNLSIISAGKIPVSPGNLLDSYRMKDLLHYWSRIYDFVLIDTPALDRAADAPILGRMADGILLVVKPVQIDRSRVDFTKETLERSGQNILGIVFNGIDPKVDASHYCYHPQKEQNALPEAKSTTESTGLWEFVSSISPRSSRLKLSSATSPKQLLEIPLDKLEDTIERLENDLAGLTSLVKEQEDELFMKRQAVKKLQRKVNLASVRERSVLEQKLTQEQEIKQMLDKTLIGQKRNLARKKQILRQYKEILQVKQP